MKESAEKVPLIKVAVGTIKAVRMVSAAAAAVAAADVRGMREAIAVRVKVKGRGKDSSIVSTRIISFAHRAASVASTAGRVNSMAPLRDHEDRSKLFP